MKILIIGSGSLTGGSLVPMLLQETDATLYTVSSKAKFPAMELAEYKDRVVHTVLDVTDKTALRELGVSVMPDVIVNLVAMTNVDKCETEKQLAWTLNVTLVENLVRVARITDAHLIHISTDYVFDGTRGPYSESDTPQPLNYYGKTKLAGETAVVTSGVSSTVLRTIVVYGYNKGRHDFVHWILDSLDSGTPIRVANDQISNPTYVDDLAEAILIVLLEKKFGLFHVGGADLLSRYDFALKIAEVFKLDPKHVQPVVTAELGQAAVRPLNGGLLTLKAEASMSMQFRGLVSGLLSYRRELFEQHSKLVQRAP